MLLNQASAPFAFAKPLRSMGVCSQYLRYKVATCIAVRDAKRQAFNSLRLLTGWALTSFVLAGLLPYAGISHAAEKEISQKPAAMSMDLIELLGELGDNEADLDAAMSSVAGNQAAKKIPQTEPPTKPVATENSNTGAKK